MQHREHSNLLTGAVACLALTAVCLITWSPWFTAQSQGAPAPAGSGAVEQDSILKSKQKPKAPISDGRPETASRNNFSAAEINSSMRARRNQAWAIVEQVWAPVSVAGGKVPAWMTWYEEQDIGPLYRELLSKQTNGRGESTPAQVRADVDAVLREHPLKDLQTSLSSARLGKTLRQFTFPGMPLLDPKRKPATGVIYYNTAFVRHLLENAERIVSCDPSALAKLNLPGSSGAGGLFGIEGLPAQLLPSDPQNRYALCMDHEMPADAIMIKANWVPVIKYDSAGNGYVDEHRIDTSAKMASTLSAYPSGTWIEIPWDEDARANGGIKAAGFRVTDEKGKEWELRGMHVVKKNLRTWMWTTLFEAGGEWNWGADKPVALTQEWTPFAHYGMCTVSNFRESDPMPWAAYEGKDEHLQSLADSIKSVARVMRGAQWCSNPYIETNLAFGNCIGCHQGSTETVLPTTVFEAVAKPANQVTDLLLPETLLRTTQMEVPFNTSDFSFSFAINRAALQEALRQHSRRPQP
jgi:hypothetical protein